MSHIAEIEIEIKDLDALEAAARSLGLELARRQTTYRWYGELLEGHPLPAGFTKADLGRCDHAIRVPGNDGPTRSAWSSAATAAPAMRCSGTSGRAASGCRRRWARMPIGSSRRTQWKSPRKRRGAPACGSWWKPGRPTARSCSESRREDGSDGQGNRSGHFSDRRDGGQGLRLRRSVLRGTYQGH